VPELPYAWIAAEAEVSTPTYPHAFRRSRVASRAGNKAPLCEDARGSMTCVAGSRVTMRRRGSATSRCPGRFRTFGAQKGHGRAVNSGHERRHRRAANRQAAAIAQLTRVLIALTVVLVVLAAALLIAA
jgi:hypothetical protein